MPITRRRFAAVSLEKPWSPVASNQWVWTNPDVVTPHTQKLPNSTQNMPLPRMERSVVNASFTAPLGRGAVT